ncbi:hypothetical protein GGH12_005326 [Coemansia sp. RSA 1822]|nr:hypothetical protein LPJ76_004966 [Coemansia sp. RSA 638]KAJ2120399.1 hypothetical protein IW147_005112 [Coemansia sp. RSA 720]KAJ2539921.1 hypothetical protein GGF49_004859 [Coemansia sp. RSA 1853]KAJ2559604.1 hypothetical protein GGH12_005326 [Coemansia sp. RSA 1822]KAJ2657916.1 hypothetical protein IW148_004944 [Coemansia sp. RSA 1199]
MDTPQPQDPTAHEIIVLSPLYHISVHFPQGSLYADVWLGINTGFEDLLVHLSALRRKALNTSPPDEIAADSANSGNVSDESGRARKDSGCHPPALNLAVRRSSFGLFNCPHDKRPLEWLVAKESLREAHSICQTHHAKFSQAVAKIQKYNRPPVPSLDPLVTLLDEMLIKNRSCPGPIDAPTCCICAASPYTRLFFSML